MVVYDLSRCLFGERLAMRALLRRAAWAWWNRWWVWLLVGRFSPRRTLTMPVADLEGLHGAKLRERLRVMMRRADGTAIGLSFAGMFLQLWVGVAVFALAVLFVPEGQTAKWQEAFSSWFGGEAVMPPLLLGWTIALSAAPAMWLVDLFMTGTGFGLYLNNRSWIEGWDVELAFKRLAERVRRLGVVAAVVVVLLGCLAGGTVRADESARTEYREEIRKVLDDKAFEVRKVKVRQWVPDDSWSLPDWLKGGIPAEILALQSVMGYVLLWGTILAVVGLLGWLVWKYRYIFQRGPKAVKSKPGVPAVAMGLALAPESLPDDPPAVALRLWREGRRREALSLLYRAAIVWFIERRQLEISESTTEEDCVRRVARGGHEIETGHFRDLTGVWLRLAYGARAVPDQRVEALCQSWPYQGKGGNGG
jgi:hypothetical protein